MSEYESARFLFSSLNRMRILEHLRDNSSRPSEIADTMSISRRTVQRNLSELVDNEYVEKRDGSYALSPAGSFVTRHGSEFVATLDLIDEYKEILNRFPDGNGPEISHLRDGRITTNSQSRPHAAMISYKNGLQDFSARRVRKIMPALNPFYVDIYEELLERGSELEIIISDQLVDVDPSDLHDPCIDALRDDRIRVYVHDDEIRVSLALTDQRALVGVYGSQDKLTASIEGTSRAFLDWAEDVYAHYWERATRSKSILPM